MVLGAGPAGRTAATLVAQAGYSTLLVERERMPREHGHALDHLRVAKGFSYSTPRAAGDGRVLAGDAWGFIDPVYSSGVYFAMKSADLDPWRERMTAEATGACADDDMVDGAPVLA